MDFNILVFVAVGFLAELIDGSLGMVYSASHMKVGSIDKQKF